MNDTLRYKDYLAQVEYDAESDSFHGRVLNVRDVLTFEGRSIAELRREFSASVEDYLEYCAARGESPERPYSGRFIVRVEPEVHRAIAAAATRSGKSLNLWVAELLEREAAPHVDREAPRRKPRALARRPPRRG